MAVLAALVSVTACERPDGDRPAPFLQERVVRTGRVHVTGSPDMVPLVTRLARHYETLHPGVVVDVVPTSTIEAIRSVRADKTMVGMVMRRLQDNELDVQGFPIARDGVAIVARANGGRDNLERQQLIALFAASGSREIQVRERGERVTGLLRRRAGIGVDAALRVGARGDDKALESFLMADAGRIVALPLAEGQDLVARRASTLKLVAINGHAASARNIGKGRYPLLQPVLLVTRDLPHGELRNFINFCMSPQAIEAVHAVGLIPYVD